jgi:hypothetical protein
MKNSEFSGSPGTSVFRRLRFWEIAELGMMCSGADSGFRLKAEVPIASSISA